MNNSTDNTAELKDEIRFLKERLEIQRLQMEEAVDYWKQRYEHLKKNNN